MTISDKEKTMEALISLMVRMGYPREFGRAIAISLGSESTMRRMMGYLKSAGAVSPEEVADEMLAITSDRDRWKEKIINEKYNQKWNEMMRSGFGEEDEDEI